MILVSSWHCHWCKRTVLCLHIFLQLVILSCTFCFSTTVISCATYFFSSTSTGTWSLHNVVRSCTVFHTVSQCVSSWMFLCLLLLSVCVFLFFHLLLSPHAGFTCHLFSSLLLIFFCGRQPQYSHSTHLFLRQLSAYRQEHMFFICVRMQFTGPPWLTSVIWVSPTMAVVGKWPDVIDLIRTMLMLA